MLSIIILYSTDRLKQFSNTLACLSDMGSFGDWEKILCVDGKTNVSPDGWKVLEIERKSRFYNWSNALNAGIKASNNQKIWYLDSDRILPVNFIKDNISKVQDNLFVFPKHLFSISDEIDVKFARKLRNDPTAHSDMLIEDHRVEDVDIQGRKGPFSGCVLFTKETYWKCGGFDPAFEAWGYPDYDFWRTAILHECDFLAIDCIELHQKHCVHSSRIFHLSNIWNCYYYCKKWNIPVDKKLLFYVENSLRCSPTKHALKDFINKNINIAF